MRVRESEKDAPFPVSDYTETRFERESGKKKNFLRIQPKRKRMELKFESSITVEVKK